MPTVNKVTRPWIKSSPKPATPNQGRANPNRDVYGSARWTNDSIAHRIANPLCEECKRNKQLTPSEVSDHVIPINDTEAIAKWEAEHDGADAVWDWRNRQALCKKCHARKSRSERG